MLNHNSSSQSEVSYNYFQDRYEVSTKVGYDAGAQVFISYGRQSNDRLLQYYGFVENDNPYDVYDFGEGIVPLMLKYGDSLQGMVDIPVDAECLPAERLQFLDSALRSTVTRQKGPDLQQGSNQAARSTSFGVGTDESSGVVISPTDDGSPGVSADKLHTKVFRNFGRGVIGGFDEITVRFLRGFLATPAEWQRLIKLPIAEIMQVLGSPLSNEPLLKSVLKAIAAIELNSKPTDLSHDMATLKTALTFGKSVTETKSTARGFLTETTESKNTKSKNKTKGWDPSGIYADSLVTALTFRIQKKKILNDLISSD
jgi:hypothetical protein